MSLTCCSWEDAVKPAYAEHKFALSKGIYGTPKHMTDFGVMDSDSSWGVEEYAAVLNEKEQRYLSDQASSGGYL